MLLSFVIPCLDEAFSLPFVIKEAHELADSLYLQSDYEIIVADNGSMDGSVNVAIEQGAYVISVKEKGYGNALRQGLSSASGDCIVMADADGSYNFHDAKEMVRLIQNGDYDVVIGDRYKGTFENGSTPWLHRYIGVPILSYIGRLRFHTDVNDFHCGLRAISRDAWNSICNSCDAEGMEFATEMIAKAAASNIKIGQTPVSLRKDFRPKGHKPHLRTIPDGWRHLKELFS